ncbi:MAG: hypothetical protein Q9200_003872 [Gallowayella weberi]
MSSDESLAHQPFPGRIRPTPGQLQTNDMNNRNQRFSWQNTPLEAQQPTFHQFSSPTNSTIDESPISPRNGYQAFPNVPQPQGGSLLPPPKPPVVRTGSPYDLGGPHGIHPAYFAPVAEETERRQLVPQNPALSQSNRTSGTDPEKVREPIGSSQPAAKLDGDPHHPKGGAEVIKADTDESVLVYNPNSLAGPNATLENHRPGQVAHPNAAVEPEWKHGMCKLDTICCTGLCCPCILYGKTQYRISRKTQQEDPTNLLGYKSCNSSCGLMAVACGMQGE